MKFYSSVHNFYRNCEMENLKKFNNNHFSNLEVIKNEEFGFFVTAAIDGIPCD